MLSVRPAAAQPFAAVAEHVPVVAHDGVASNPQEKDLSDARRLLTRIEGALASGDSRSLLPFLNAKMFLTLFTGESGYYSAEQAAFILRNFFHTHSSIGCSFHNTNVGDDSAFGVGTLTFVKRGQRGSAQVFVSLAAGKGGWRITQITVAQR
ncbi:MAG: DUF4783 domain-containing protein [Ignavibacteria bacterium]|nr:DUF4783 domain-containing protein [Ignavibacteria bacterium]